MEGPKFTAEEADSGVFLTPPISRFVRHLERILQESSEATIWALAERMLGRGTVRVLPTLSRGRAALSWVVDRWVIYVRPGMSEREQEEGIAHELAEWAIQVVGAELDDPEAVARSIADRLLLYLPPQDVA